MNRNEALADFTKGYCFVCEEGIPHFMEQQVARTINKIYDDFETESLTDNDLLAITYEAGRQAGKDSMKSELAKAYMEGSESGRESMEKQDD